MVLRSPSAASRLLPSSIALAALLLATPGRAVAQPTAPTPPPDSPAPAPGGADTTPAPDATAAPEAAPAEAAAPEAAPAEAPAADAGASLKYDKGFTLASPDEKFELKIGIRSQARVEISHPDPDVGPDEFQSHFVIPRLRLQLEGFAFGKENAYKVEFDMANKGSALLKDFFVQHDFGGIFLRVGQWKRPFSRHEMVSDFSGEFNERSIANEFGGGGRDLGVAVHNNYDKSPDGLEWAAGLFNGTGEKQLPTAVKCPAGDMDPADCTVGTPTNVPTDFKPVFVARAGWNGGGIKGYSEGDVEGGDELRYAVGASYKLDFNNFAKNVDDEVQLGHAVEVDAILKIMGFAATGAVYLVKNGDADAENGFFVQSGYMVLPKKMEVAARFSQIPDEKAAAAGMDGEHIQEILGALNWYFDGHNFKWMTDFGPTHATAAGGTMSWQVRSQLQVVF